MDKSPIQPIDEDTLDHLLAELTYEVPPGFAERLTKKISGVPDGLRIASSNQQVHKPEKISRRYEWLQLFALITGGALGIGQIATAIFGLWLSTAAW
jgi:hypothetical protein